MSPGVARRTADDSRHQVVPAFLQQRRRNFGLAPVERRRQGPLPLQLGGARGTLVQMLVYLVFLVRCDLTVEIERNQLRNRIAVHTKSPNTPRIFCVARKRQFFAASSDRKSTRLN